LDAGTDAGTDQTPAPAATERTRSEGSDQAPSSTEGEDLEVFDDPGCPEKIEPLVEETCSPFDSAGTCIGDWGCYPYVDYPSSPCEPERFGTRCEPAGSGVQGDDCRAEGCAPGFLCVASGQGTLCAELCPLPGPNTCAAGLICGSVDIQGFGVCF
jgi:hypothetical protein